MPVVPIKRAPTLFLKAVTVLLGAVVLVLCAFLFPELWQGARREIPQFALLLYPALFGFYATVIPFFLALYQALKLLQNIDRNNAFSEASVQALKVITWCAVSMSALYAMSFPLVALLSELDDAPGGIIIGMAIVLAPLIVATFAAVLRKLVQSAIDLKTENDFTI